MQLDPEPKLHAGLFSLRAVGNIFSFQSTSAWLEIKDAIHLKEKKDTLVTCLQ